MKKVISVFFTMAKALIMVVIFTLVLRMVTRNIAQESIGQGWRFMSFALAGLFCGFIWDKLKLEDIGLKISFNVIFCFLVGGIAVFVTLLIVSNVLKLDLPSEINLSSIASKKNEVLNWFLVACGEEVLFRGYLFGKLKKDISEYSSAIFSSLLFCLLHSVSGAATDVYSYLFIFVVGLLLCRIAVLFQSIWFGIGFHTFWNFFSTYIENTKLEYPATISIVICLVIVVVVSCLSKQTDCS